MKFHRLSIVVLVLVLSFAALNAMQLYVPVQDPVYDYLERMATRGIIPQMMNDTRPLQRDIVVKYLLNVKDNEMDLTRIDREILYNFLSEYRRELKDRKHPAITGDNDHRLGIASFDNLGKDLSHVFRDDLNNEKRHIYICEDEKTTVWVGSDFTVRGEAKNKTLRFVDQLGGQAFIQAGEHLAFFVDGYFFHQYKAEGWEEPAKEFKGYWYNDYEYENYATFDRSEAYANITGDFGTLTIAHYPFNWGNSLNSVILSADAVPFGSLQWSRKFKHFKYTFLHGSLMTNTYTLTGDGRNYIPKYLVAHRIEMHMSPRFHINFSEMLIYGNRIPEATYLVPMVFLWPSEHALGDRDNNMIALETEIFPLNGLRLYGTVFLDELAFSKLFQDWWANKFAVQGGFQWSPRSLPADLIFEATAVHPWTYTHKYSFGSHTHHSKDLGFFAGPNSQLITAKINYDLSRKSRLTLSYNRLLEGADSLMVDGTRYPSGGESNQNYEDMAPQLEFATTWLMGDITKNKSLRLEWLYRWRNQVTFLSACELRNVQGDRDFYYSLQININY
ncbi:MAG: hypothetical protein R6V48_02800 [Fidelibacterota bacterium]